MVVRVAGVGAVAVAVAVARFEGAGGRGGGGGRGVRLRVLAPRVAVVVGVFFAAPGPVIMINVIMVVEIVNVSMPMTVCDDRQPAEDGERDFVRVGGSSGR